MLGLNLQLNLNGEGEIYWINIGKRRLFDLVFIVKRQLSVYHA